MQTAHDYLRTQDRTRAIVHAQSRVEAFYETLGYETVDDVEDKTGIPHLTSSPPYSLAFRFTP